MKHVLVFDRALPVRMRIRELLAEYSVQTLEADSDGEALNTLSRVGDTLDMMIVDVAFDSNYGYDFIKKIRKEYPGISIIICTSSNKRSDFIRGVQAGASDYILKPFEDDLFMKRIMVHLNAPKTSHVPAGTGEKAKKSSVNFFDTIKSEKYKANKGKYPLTVFSVMFYRNDEVAGKSYDAEYMRFAERHFEDIQSRLWESDEITVYGPQVFLGVLPFCDEAGFRVAKSKLIQYLISESADREEYSAYQWVVSGITLKTERDYHTETEEIIDALRSKMSIEAHH